MESPTSVFPPLRVREKVSRITCGILYWSCISRAIHGAFEPFVDEIDLAKIAFSCHFALDIFCYKELFTILHDAASGTIAREVCLFWYGTIATLVH